MHQSSSIDSLCDGSSSGDLRPVMEQHVLPSKTNSSEDQRLSVLTTDQCSGVVERSQGSIMTNWVTSAEGAASASTAAKEPPHQVNADSDNSTEQRQDSERVVVADPTSRGCRYQDADFEDVSLASSIQRRDSNNCHHHLDSVSEQVFDESIGSLVPSDWIKGSCGGHLEDYDDGNFGDYVDPSMVAMLQKLTLAERTKILEVMRRDTVVQLYTELKVR